MRIYGIVKDSIVDGPGFRTAIFTQGCPHHCPGCHNPESHDPQGGKEMTLDEVTAAFTGNPLLSGITLTGGEPFAQAADCAELARRAREKGLTVWCYTGYTYEQLVQKQDEAVNSLLHWVDVLVDGPFLLAQRSLELDFRGSKNQRLIDLPKTLVCGVVTLYQPPEW